MLLLMLAMADLSAQSVEGTVVDSAGAPVVDAFVTLERAGQEGVGGLRAMSDGRGQFRFASVPFGNHVLRVRRLGYHPVELAVRVPREGVIERRVTLQRSPQLLAGVRIVDQNACDATSLAGFECRRYAGVGRYRDVGEIRALEPRNWVDMLDGMPGIRRRMIKGPFGLDVRPAPPNGRCLQELWNGQPPSSMDYRVRAEDVVAIEYYDRGNKVPAAYRRYFRWYHSRDCALIIYWVRGAPAGEPFNPDPS